VPTTEKKRILFVTDFSPNENGYAGPQTAYNFIKLFDGQEKIILINEAHYKEIRPNTEWTKNKDFFLFNYLFNYSTRNRLNKFCNSIKAFVNPRYFYLNKKLSKKVTSFEPQSIICIPNDAYNYRAGLEIKRKFPHADLFFYIMDDYKHYEKPYLLQTLNDTLSYTKGWISISAPMVELFESKYPALKGKPNLVIQNPVNLSSLKKKHDKNYLGKVKMVYAGSVYPNHKDSLLKVIDAINLSGKDIELSIFTKPEFRECFKEKESDKVIYKGNLNYKELLSTLPQFDYGLVTETFLPEFANFAKSSIQTKVNDYILSGCLPVVVGPVYGACVNNVISNNIGYTTSDDDKKSILIFLNSLKSDENYNSVIRSAQDYLFLKLTEAKTKVVNFVN
jgi:hypothetical protein